MSEGNQRGRYTKSELIERIQEVIEDVGEIPTTRYWAQIDEAPSRLTLRRHFGTYNKAIEATGYNPNPAKSERGLVYTTDELKNRLQKYCQELGRTPTNREFDVADEQLPHKQVYIERFGSLDKALAVVGFERKSPKTQNWDKDGLIDTLQQYYERCGEVPSSSQASSSETSLPSAETFRRHFGSWNNALESAGLPTQLPLDENTQD